MQTPEQPKLLGGNPPPKCRKGGGTMDESLVRDIYQRLGGIEAKVDDIRAIRNTANDAQATANLALDTAKRVESELNEMQTEHRTNKRWLIGLIVSTVFSVIGVVFAIINAI